MLLSAITVYIIVSRWFIILALLLRYFALKYSADAVCTVLRVDQVRVPNSCIILFDKQTFADLC